MNVWLSLHPLYNAHNCSKAWHADQVHRSPHKSAKKYVKLWSWFIYVLKNNLTATVDFSDARASETADRRNWNTELLANPKNGSTADARPQQTDRLTSFCSVCRHNKSSSGHTAACSPSLSSQPGMHEPLSLLQSVSELAFQTLSKYALLLSFTEVPCPLIIHRNPIPNYHRHPLSSLPSNHTQTSLAR